MTNPRDLERQARHVNPGGWAVESARPIATLLGSCVSVCLWDPQLRIGGLNHFMLPRHAGCSGMDMDVLLGGNYCMEALMNAMLSRGARKARLQAKAFGGGSVVVALATGTRIGQINAEFACEWLAREGIPLRASDMMGPWARKVILDPHTGAAFCRRVPTDQSIAEAEKAYARTLVGTPKKPDIELF